jgi:hypothetical protein
MADVYPDEGCDLILASFPKGATPPATLYVGMFTSSGGPTSVPPRNATLAALPAGFAEVSTAGWSTYARQPVTAASWSAPASGTLWGVSGRIVTGPQVSFPLPTGIYTPADPIVGFLVADSLTGGKAVYYSNFADLTPIVTLAIGDSVRVTPQLLMGS